MGDNRDRFDSFIRDHGDDLRMSPFLTPVARMLEGRLGNLHVMLYAGEPPPTAAVSDWLYAAYGLRFRRLTNTAGRMALLRAIVGP